MFHLNRKYHPWGLINDLKTSNIIGNTGMHCPIHFTLSDAKDAWLLSVELDLLAPWRPTSPVSYVPAAGLVALAIAGCLQGGPMVFSTGPPSFLSHFVRLL